MSVASNNLTNISLRQSTCFCNDTLLLYYEKVTRRRHYVLMECGQGVCMYVCGGGGACLKERERRSEGG